METDLSGRRLPARTEAACEGAWVDGACWARAEDGECAHSDGSETGCARAALCEYEPVTKRCFSASTLEEHAGGPEVASSDVPGYLAKYFDARGPAPPPGPLLGPACFKDDTPPAHQLEVRLLLGSMLKERRRGILAWHSTGSGKLLTVANALAAFWQTKKKELWYVTTEAALAINPLIKVQAKAARLPEFGRYLGDGAGHDALARAFAERGVRAMTYAELADHESLPADLVIIADEAHHLLEPRLIRLQSALMSAPRGVVLVALTATPGPFPEATLMLLNMLRPSGSSLYALDDPGLEKRVHDDHVVSFYDASSDDRHFAKVRIHRPPPDVGVPAEAKIPSIVASVLRSSGDRHLVWAPAYAHAVSVALKEADVPHTVLTAPDADVVKHFNVGKGPRVIVVANPSLGEALDLRGVRHVHVLDDTLDRDGLRQVVGRAWRYCSHAALPSEDWTIDAHVYVTRVPGRMSVRIRKLAGVASRGLQLVTLLTRLTDVVRDASGVDLEDASSSKADAKVDKAVRVGLAKLAKKDPEAAANAESVWKELPKLRAELEKVSHELHEADLQTLVNVHIVDDHLHKTQSETEDTHVAFYDMLRRAATL